MNNIARRVSQLEHAAGIRPIDWPTHGECLAAMDVLDRYDAGQATAMEATQVRAILERDAKKPTICRFNAGA
ncbi:MAG TPA: hypothetical protein VGQ93_17875 [Lysobacter sp.]|nr:hypothetical protein [Lysobacter sp.]